MSLYNNFVGIDIGKFNFVVASHSSKDTKEYENNPVGIKSFLKDYKSILKNSLCVLETTGGYETKLLNTLCDKKIAVHRANTRKVKSFIRSFGNKAKTDALDAKALALYGCERKDTLAKFVPVTAMLSELYALAQRRHDLKQIIVAEKNRCQAPGGEYVQKSCKSLLELLTKQVKNIDERINTLVNGDNNLKMKKAILKTIPGVGDIIANELLILMPELGTMNRREVASLTGVAPMANESGRSVGYRRTGDGRSTIKPVLFMAAMAASHSKSELGKFYANLIARGKKKMVALVALMRKIIVIANARLKSIALPNNKLGATDEFLQKNSSQSASIAPSSCDV
jgi:transposase